MCLTRSNCKLKKKKSNERMKQEKDGRWTAKTTQEEDINSRLLSRD